nr:T9SS type A sorting domain-containing protein [uncultured Brumimicrobium sp.]
MKKTILILSAIALSSLGGVLNAQQIPTQDLVVEYKFDNNDLIETSGSTYNAGGLTSSGTVSYVQGIETATSAISPDGASLSNVGNITFSGNVKEYVVSFWFKASPGTGNFKLLELKDPGSSNELTIDVFDNNNGNNSLVISQASIGVSPAGWYNYFESYLDNEWHHLAVKLVYWTGGGKYYLRTYLDNAEVMDVQNQVSLSDIWVFGGLDIYLPSQATGNGTSQDLKIDNFRFYEFPITQTDIAALYNEKNNTVGVEDIESSENISIYPNPTNGDFSIDLGETIQSLTIYITDITGKEVYSNGYKSTQKVNLNLNDSPGVYFVTIEADGVQSKYKLIKK